MHRPTEEQLHTALTAAGRLRDLDHDGHALGRSLLYLQHRNQALERVYEAAKRYLHSGQDQHTHVRLVQAVEAARRQLHEDSTSLEPDSAFGLE